jgi:hypothetical protein
LPLHHSYRRGSRLAGDAPVACISQQEANRIRRGLASCLLTTGFEGAWVGRRKRGRRRHRHAHVSCAAVAGEESAASSMEGGGHAPRERKEVPRRSRCKYKNYLRFKTMHQTKLCIETMQNYTGTMTKSMHKNHAKHAKKPCITISFCCRTISM